MIKINDDIYVYPFDDSCDQPNIGYIKGNNKALLVDVGGAKRVLDNVLNDIMSMSLIKPTLAVITHYHWDHSFASYYFNGTLYGSKRINENFDDINKIHAVSLEDLISDTTIPLFCLIDLKKEYNSVDEIKLRKMDEIVEEEKTIDLGNKIIKIIPSISPHTHGSLLIYSPSDKVLFVGDAEYGHIYEEEFITNEELLEIYINVIKNIDCDIIVNGHSNIMTKEEYLVELTTKE